MKKFWVLVVIFSLLLSAEALAAQKFSRFSSNPIGKLNVVGVALSEDTASAKKIIEETLKGKMRGEMNFPIYVDPTYKQLKSEKAIDISFFGSSASGKKYEANSDTALNLKANPATIMIIDRQKKYAAFLRRSSAIGMKWERSPKNSC